MTGGGHPQDEREGAPATVGALARHNQTGVAAKQVSTDDSSNTGVAYRIASAAVQISY